MATSWYVVHILLLITSSSCSSQSFPSADFGFSLAASFVPGAYAIHIDARLPDDIVEQLEENGIRVYSVMATTEKPS